MRDDISPLEAPTEEERLDALRDVVSRNEGGILDMPTSGEVNNHVHTHYSFSPYSPVSAAYMARKSGLEAVGSVDHDSIGAAREMTSAARILGIGSTVGAELRVSFVDTPFADVRLNNPDSIGIAYIVLHGVPAPRIDELQRFLHPLRRVRNERNRRQVVRLNDILVPAGLDPLDFDRDVLPLSWSDRGGSVTERHILYALAIKLEAAYGRGEVLLRVVEGALDLPLGARQRDLLVDARNPHYLYDLLGVFKGGFAERFFIQPGDDECLPVRRIAAFARALGAIPAYAYLGDVGDSPTGDKKAQHFEDAYFEELAAALPEIGFQAITYMPPRNTAAQLHT
ncbi:MAG: PHP domain-containing protein, partial [Spirochaetales bacterium]|nr:PHP domain-containing protein [Spirochaetales bacterium]